MKSNRKWLIILICICSVLCGGHMILAKSETDAEKEAAKFISNYCHGNSTDALMLKYDDFSAQYVIDKEEGDDGWDFDSGSCSLKPDGVTITCTYFAKTNGKYYLAYDYNDIRKQKVFCEWVTAEGKVFNHIQTVSEEEFKRDFIVREIGIGCDYGSVNPTTFCGLALCQNTSNGNWELVLIDNYYHDPKIEGDTPTTEFYSHQLKAFVDMLHNKYKYVPVNTLTIDSEASHFSNRLDVDGIRHELAKKNNMSVDESVQLMQSLFYTGILKVLKCDSIRYFQNGQPVYRGMNVGLDELESYHYDKLKSETSGTNSYVKEYDHYVDGSRYIIMEFKLTGRCPEV